MTKHIVLTQKPTGGQLGIIASLEPSPANAVILNVLCEATVYIGAAVRMKSNGEAVNALADTMENSNVVGIVEAKPSADRCNIRFSNITEELFTGLDVTKDYFLSDTVAGGLQTTVPITSGHIKLKIGQPFSDKILLVMKGERAVRL